MYEDKESLRRSIIELVDLAIQYGLPWIEMHGGPYLRPTEEAGRELLDNYERLAKAFAERLGLSLNDPNALARVEEILLERKKERGVDWELRSFG